MAIPLLAYAIAALVAGTAANVAGQRKQSKAIARANQTFADRLRARSQEATGIFEGQLAKQNEDALEQVAQNATDKERRVEDLVESDPPLYDPVGSGETSRLPKVIQGQASHDLARELAKAKAKIAADARLEGFSTRTFDRGLQLRRSAPELGNIGLFAQGDRNMFGADLARAQGKGSGMMTLGDLLTAAGSIMMMGAGAGAAGAGKVAGSAAMQGTAAADAANKARFVPMLFG